MKNPAFHPLKNWHNPLTHHFDDALLGMFIVSASSIIAECCATTNLDWVAIDIEASPATRQDLIHMAQAFNGSSMALLARIAQKDQQHIESALDSGIHGIIVPKISNREAALAVVKASYYHPLGKRGLNPIRCSGYFSSVEHYLQNAKNISCIVQIETQEAIENLEEIASIEGIDGLFIGSGDLALDYGIPGQFEHKQMQNAIESVLAICKKYHRVPGIFAYNNALAKQYREMGFKLIGIGNEIKFLRHGIEEAITEITTASRHCEERSDAAIQEK